MGTHGRGFGMPNEKLTRDNAERSTSGVLYCKLTMRWTLLYIYMYIRVTGGSIRALTSFAAIRG